MLAQSIQPIPAHSHDFIFSLGLDDLATRLCAANTAVGLAKLHWVQRELGVAPDAFFLGGPDMTVTRNHARWYSNFAYGGKVDWSGPLPFIVLEVKPNVCGMLVAEVEEWPSSADLQERILLLKADPGELQGIPLEFDLDRSNHFVDLFTSSPDCSRSGKVVVLHGAAPELRGDNPLGVGLYVERSPRLQETCERFITPWGSLQVALGEQVEEYLQAHARAAAFAAERRLKFARRLFGEVRVISNALHQGLVSWGEMYLGCHPVTDAQELLPFMVAPDEPGYLLRGRPQLGELFLEEQGWRQRADRLGLSERLAQTSLLPHGAGYAVAGPGRITVEPLTEGLVVYLQRGSLLTLDPRKMVTGYRGHEVLRRTVELGLGEVACDLEALRTVIAPEDSSAE